MKVDRAQIGCIIVWPEAGESAIGCAVSRNTIAKGPLPPSHAGDIERICRELRKVQSAEKTADKTRSEPPGGVERGGEKGRKGDRERAEGEEPGDRWGGEESAWAYRSNYRVVRYGFMQIRQKRRGSFGINGGRTNVSRFFC